MLDGIQYTDIKLNNFDAMSPELNVLQKYRITKFSPLRQLLSMFEFYK